MIKLNCGLSRKIGEPNYGSRGASVNVELELESSAAQDNQLLHEKIRKLFILARSAVDEELDNGAKEAPATAPPASAATNGGAHRPATAAQINAIRSICKRLNTDPESEARNRLNCGLEQLTLSQASALIDQIKG